jgi:hypothetical protein
VVAEETAFIPSDLRNRDVNIISSPKNVIWIYGGKPSFNTRLTMLISYQQNLVADTHTEFMKLEDPEVLASESGNPIILLHNPNFDPLLHFLLMSTTP